MNKIIEYSLYLLVFLLPWQTRWIIKAGELNGGAWEYGTVALYGIDILLFFIFVLLFLQFSKQVIGSKIKNIFNFKNYKLFGIYNLLLGFLFFSVLSIFFAEDKLLAVYVFIRLLLGAGLFYFIVKLNYDYFKLIFSFLAGLVSPAFLAIWQFISQNTFSGKWLGLASHKTAELGTSVIEIFPAGALPERWLRAYGSFDHPNILGGVMAVGILLVVNLVIKYQGKIKNKMQSLLYVFLILFSAALFFSFSRGAWLGLVLAFFILFFILLFTKNYKELKIVSSTFGVVLATVLPLLFVYQNLIFTRFSQQTRLEKKSIEERVASNNEAKGVINENWLFGVGIGNYGLASAKQTPGQISWYYQPVHNVFLLVWSELGIFGFIFFIGILFSSMIRNFKIKNIVNLAIIALIVLIMMLDHWLWSLHFGVLFFWLVTGLMHYNNQSLSIRETEKIE